MYICTYITYIYIYICIYIYIYYIMITYLLHSKVSFVAVICHLIYYKQCPWFPYLKNNQVGFHLLLGQMSLQFVVFFMDFNLLEALALRERETKAVVTGTTVVLFSYDPYPYLFENPIKTYESKLLVIYFFNFCTVYIFYATVQVICLICLRPILKTPFSFFFLLPSPKLCYPKTSLQPLLLSLCCSAVVAGVSEKLWL